MIPKTIHYCWLSGDPFPDLVKRCFASWKEKLADYEVVLWDINRVEKEFQGFRVSEETNYTNYNEFHEGFSVSNGNLWLRQSIGCGKYAFAADYIRLFALYHYGGIYLDTDVEIIGSFDPFLAHNVFIGFDADNDLEPAIVGAIPGQFWIKKLLSYYDNRSFIKEDGKFDTRPLPTIFNDSANQLFNFKRNGKFQMMGDQSVFVYPSDYFSPKNVYFDKIKRTKNTVAIHYFAGSWLEKTLRYKLKLIFHRILLATGGKIFHDKIVRLYREDLN